MFKKIKENSLFYLPIIKILFKQPKYIKYIFSWRKSPLDIEMPWVNFDTKEWLDKNLNKKMVVFEYGSGGSTFYYSKKVKKIISVEHDQSWYETVKNKLVERGINNFELYCCQPEQTSGSEDGFYFSSGKHYKNKSFKKYAEKINDYPDDFFDLVVVDGRARNGCINNILPKVKNGGCVLLDNSDREEYNPSIKLLDKFEVKIFFSPGFYDNIPWGARIWQIRK